MMHTVIINWKNKNRESRRVILTPTEALKFVGTLLETNGDEIDSYSIEPSDAARERAYSTLNQMLASAVETSDQDSYRLAKEREEYKKDPAPDTKAIVERLERKHGAGRLRIEALRYAIERI